MGFAQIYICQKHGETIHPVETEFIDCENDDVEFYLLCPQSGCTREVSTMASLYCVHSQKKKCFGKPIIQNQTMSSRLTQGDFNAI